MRNHNKGITLVALVITVIILLILATISIQSLTSTGLFKRAQEAQNLTQEKTAEENEILTNYLEQMNKIISEGKTEKIPDGAIVNPINDVTIWLKTGEISKKYAYTTIEEVISDNECMESLMKSENAMKYLARSTNFANAICENENAMTYLGHSSYIDDTLLNNDLWAASTWNSQYFDKVYKAKLSSSDYLYELLSNEKSMKNLYSSVNDCGKDTHVFNQDLATYANNNVSLSGNMSTGFSLLKSAYNVHQNNRICKTFDSDVKSAIIILSETVNGNGYYGASLNHIPIVIGKVNSFDAEYYNEFHIEKGFTVKACPNSATSSFFYYYTNEMEKIENFDVQNYKINDNAQDDYTVCIYSNGRFGSYSKKGYFTTTVPDVSEMKQVCLGIASYNYVNLKVHSFVLNF